MNINKSKYFLYNSLLNSPIIFLIISSIVLAVFSGVLTADFVMFDDDIIIYNNSKLGGLSFKSICWAFTDVNSMVRYNPLTLLSWSATFHFFGLRPFGYHLVNWLLYGLSAGLLFLIIKKILLLSSKTNQNNTYEYFLHLNIAAALATLFWALHPLRVEPVAWATQRTYCQALFFLLLSTLFYLKAIDFEFNKKRYFPLIGSSLIFYIISLLSYAIGITYVAVFIILDIFLFKRIGGSIGWWKSHMARKVVVEKLIFALPAVLIGAISVIVRIQFAGKLTPPVSLSEFGLIDRIMQAMYILSYYIWRPFYPFDLSPVYNTLISFDPLSLPFILSAFSIIALFIVLFIMRINWPIGFALILTYIILLIPVTGFFEHPHFHCDRYSLVVSICLSILIAYGLMKLLHNKLYSVISISSLLVIISLLGWLSYYQMKIWNNSESLFTYTIKALGNDPYRQDIYWRLGKYFYQKHDRNNAIMNFEKTIAINQYHPMANTYLAQMEDERGNLDKTAYYLQNLIFINPHNFGAHYRLSQVFKKLNKYNEASYHYQIAVNLQAARKKRN